jgi:hypothetical protein
MKYLKRNDMNYTIEAIEDLIFCKRHELADYSGNVKDLLELLEENWSKRKDRRTKLDDKLSDDIVQSIKDKYRQQNNYRDTSSFEFERNVEEDDEIDTEYEEYLDSDYNLNNYNDDKLDKDAGQDFNYSYNYIDEEEEEDKPKERKNKRKEWEDFLGVEE